MDIVTAFMSHLPEVNSTERHTSIRLLSIQYGHLRFIRRGPVVALAQSHPPSVPGRPNAGYPSYNSYGGGSGGTSFTAPTVQPQPLGFPNQSVFGHLRGPASPLSMPRSTPQLAYRPQFPAERLGRSNAPSTPTFTQAGRPVLCSSVVQNTSRSRHLEQPPHQKSAAAPQPSLSWEPITVHHPVDAQTRSQDEVRRFAIQATSHRMEALASPAPVRPFLGQKLAVTANTNPRSPHPTASSGRLLSDLLESRPSTTATPGRAPASGPELSNAGFRQLSLPPLHLPPVVFRSTPAPPQSQGFTQGLSRSTQPPCSPEAFRSTQRVRSPVDATQSCPSPDGSRSDRRQGLGSPERSHSAQQRSPSLEHSQPSQHQRSHRSHSRSPERSSSTQNVQSLRPVPPTPSPQPSGAQPLSPIRHPTPEGDVPVVRPHLGVGERQAKKNTKDNGLNEAISAFCDHQDEEIKRIAAEWKRPILSIKKLVGTHRKFREERKPSLYNALMHKKAQDDRLAGRRVPKSFKEKHKAMGEDEDVQDILNDPECEEAVQAIEDLQAYREAKIMGARASSKANDNDIVKTWGDLANRAQNLSKRTSAATFGFVCSSKAGQNVSRQFFGNGPIEAFLMSKFKMTGAEFVEAAEAYFIYSSTGRTATGLGVKAMQKEATKLILQGLRDITGNPKLNMEYDHYEVLIVYRYGVQLFGWPTGVEMISPHKLTAPDAIKIYQALETRTCQWRKLDGIQFHQIKKSIDSRIKAKVLVLPERSRRGGKKRPPTLSSKTTKRRGPAKGKRRLAKPPSRDQVSSDDDQDSDGYADPEDKDDEDNSSDGSGNNGGEDVRASRTRKRKRQATAAATSSKSKRRGIVLTDNEDDDADDDDDDDEGDGYADPNDNDNGGRKRKRKAGAAASTSKSKRRGIVLSDMEDDDEDHYSDPNDKDEEDSEVDELDED
ncbi:hypothetical protein EV361DRAFT_1019830 [Lentinula raphanica]|nr:hypothetical protein EV361DRAFT_1019830 [Lentinula raphanica]